MSFSLDSGFGVWRERLHSDFQGFEEQCENGFNFVCSKWISDTSICRLLRLFALFVPCYWHYGDNGEKLYQLVF